MISGFAGFLILSKEESRRQYPHKFIGMICLAQAMSFGFLNYFDADFCSQVQVPWIASMLIAPDSWSSRVLFGGWTWTSYTKTDIAGILNLSYNVGYHVALYSEMLLSVCLNLDVVSTIRYPFNRNENLKYILWFMRIGFFLIALNSILAVVSVLKTSEST